MDGAGERPDREGAAERVAEAYVRARSREAALRADLDALMAATADANGDDEHDPEGATAGFERAQLQGLLDAALAEAEALEAARSRLADGTYGTCARCAIPIAPERLTARPAATTCITCARRGI